ncbi:hypothetical protein MLD38_035765 [Melastoma candidum]|uniref:Uncharacterized protein n=1 Tax=Melastoma candidum TaxID=119954 RepID=A0ACB9LI45_9MYRT|nr:hypothetical protein MLD38_035765 [Melastoma candidum]
MGMQSDRFYLPKNIEFLNSEQLFPEQYIQVMVGDILQWPTVIFVMVVVDKSKGDPELSQGMSVDGVTTWEQVTEGEALFNPWGKIDVTLPYPTC